MVTLCDIEEPAQGHGSMPLRDDFRRKMATLERAPLMIGPAFVNQWRLAARFARAAEPVSMVGSGTLDWPTPKGRTTVGRYVSGDRRKGGWRARSTPSEIDVAFPKYEGR
jgi:hypothetical protein